MRIKYMPIRLILLLLSLGVSQSLLAQQIYKANEAGQLLKQANLNSQTAEFKRMSSDALIQSTYDLLAAEDHSALAREHLLFHATRQFSAGTPSQQVKVLLRQLSDFDSQVYWQTSHLGRPKQELAYPIAGLAASILNDWSLDEQASQLMLKGQLDIATLEQFFAGAEGDDKNHIFSRFLKQQSAAQLSELASWSMANAESMSTRQLLMLATAAADPSIAELAVNRLQADTQAQADVIRALESLANTLADDEVWSLSQKLLQSPGYGATALQLIPRSKLHESQVQEALLKQLGNSALGGDAAYALSQHMSPALSTRLVDSLADANPLIAKRSALALSLSNNPQPVKAQSASNSLWTYTENQTGANQIALGYPVPIPVESLVPVAGFRSYASLHARHQDLMLTHDFITGQVVGQTFNGRDIWAYQISDQDTLTDGGLSREGAVMQNGTIHSREWQSPEVTTALIERFAQQAGDNGIYDYLINNLNIVILPVMNIDGFLQTQRYPDQARQTTFASDPDTWPRDGRFRRKNMRGADEDINTTADTLQGVDLNRNHAPFWASTERSSSDSNSLVYHGMFAGSEPESQAMYAAAELGPADRLRMYIDTHSYSQLWFQPYTNNDRRNAISDVIALRMRNATGNSYTISPNDPGTGIGATDDYFAETYQIPSYTLEIEPGSGGGTQYGGFAVSHSGFVLPESEIARVREELTNASLIAWYMQAGPAALSDIQIKRTDTNEIVFAGRWQQTTANSREWTEDINTGLQNGIEYQLWVAYDKPMRWLDENDQILRFPNVPGTLQPAVKLEGLNASGEGFEQMLEAQVSDWLTTPGGAGIGYLRYKADSFMLNFTVDSTITVEGATLMALAFETIDMAGGTNDANPATVIDYNIHWRNYEASDGSDSDIGGIDRMIRLVDDGSALYNDPNESVAPPPPPPPTPEPSPSGGGGVFGYGILLWLLWLVGRFCIIRGRHGKVVKQ